MLKNKEQKSDEERLDFQVRKQRKKRLEEIEDQDKNDKTKYPGPTWIVFIQKAALPPGSIHPTSYFW